MLVGERKPRNFDGCTRGADTCSSSGRKASANRHSWRICARHCRSFFARNRRPWVKFAATSKAELNSPATHLHLVQRKNRLLKILAETGQTVVFDGVGWTTPKISSFLESAMGRTPVWICCRSAEPWDIGHVWPLLARFQRVEVKPFHLSETRMLVAAAVRAGFVSRDTLNAISPLHRRASGNPKVLRALLDELARGHCDLSHPRSLARLDLARRIHELFPAPATIRHA